MPATSTSLRVLTGWIIAVTLLTGCQTLDDADRVIGRADLVNDLAAQLDSSGKLTYSADYQLPGGRSGSILQAQLPPRTAYRYPGGQLIVSAESTIECETSGSRSSCTVNPPILSSSRVGMDLLAEANRQGLITPPAVIELLTTAALDPGAVIVQNDTTVAGRHATCVRVEQVDNAAGADFDACITTDGVLGSFSGTIDGSRVEIALTRYRDTVDSAAFDLPDGAGVVDRRPPPR
jgi:hypothetical protein